MEYLNFDYMVKITYDEDVKMIGELGMIIGKAKPEGLFQSWEDIYVLTKYGVRKKATDCVEFLSIKCTRIFRLLYI